MGGERIEVGAVIELRRQQYSIVGALDGDRLRLESIDGSTRPLVVPRTQLERAYIDGLLKFPAGAWIEDLSKDADAPKLPQDVALLPEPLLQETRRRAEYVKAVLKVPDRRWDQKSLGPTLDRVAEHLGDQQAPSLSTVRRWNNRYVESDKDIRALIPRVKWRGSRRRRLHPLVVKIMEAMIERYYLSSSRKTVVEVYDYVRVEIERANRSRDLQDQLALPSERLVYNEIAKLDPYRTCVARYGKPYADRKFAQTGQGIRATRPLERVEIDHTKADLMVVDDQTRLPIGRPWITVLIDKYTRMVFGIHIGFTPPSFISVMHALRHGILPKADLRERFPEIENDWPIYGKPETIIADNGAEFLSKSFEQALNDIGTELELNDPGHPNQKGAIERFLGRVNRGLLQGQPGTTFSNILDRKDYDPAKNAVIPLSLLKRLIFRFICDIYHVSYHRGLGGQPLAVYQDAAKKYPPPALPRSVDELSPMLCTFAEKSVHHYGIEILGLKYNCTELSAIRHRLNGQKVKIRFDEENLASIYVWDDFEQRYLTVPCTTPEYAEGLTLWQHKVIRRNAVATGKSKTDAAQLARVRREIQEVVETCWLKRSKSAHKQKAARWLRVDHETAGIPKDSISLSLISLAENSPAAHYDESDDAVLMERLIQEGWAIDEKSVGHRGGHA